MNILNIVMLGIALVGYSQVASLGPPRNCVESDRLRVLSCSGRILGFSSNLKLYKIKSDMKEIKLNCNLIDKCFKSVAYCNEFYDEVNKNTIDMVQTYCRAVNYVANDFAACSEKINNSTCYNDWDPFLDYKDLKDEKKAEEKCKNFFGKDQCLKKEILENCSEKEWKGFRDHFIALNNDVMKQCNFKNAV